MEKGLLAVGRALRPLPGSKAVLFFGYGVGRYSASGSAADYSMGRFDSTPDLAAAQQALAAAQAPVFSLDVSSGAHSLEAGLKQLSFDTGGFYMRTETFPRWAMGAVREAMRGHYAVVFVKPTGKPGLHKITIELMRGAAVLSLSPGVRRQRGPVASRLLTPPPSYSPSTPAISRTNFGTIGSSGTTSALPPRVRAQRWSQEMPPALRRTCPASGRRSP